jgi:hypothetical protein
MHSDPRPHIRRRRFAIDRLRALSRGAAVAGVAGTAAFGVVAAASWSGDPNATPLPASTPGADSGGTTIQPPAAQGAQPAPNTGFGQPPAVTTPRSNRGTGGHAATGGSR